MDLIFCCQSVMLVIVTSIVVYQLSMIFGPNKQTAATILSSYSAMRKLVNHEPNASSLDDQVSPNKGDTRTHLPSKRLEASLNALESGHNEPRIAPSDLRNPSIFPPVHGLGTTSQPDGSRHSGLKRRSIIPRRSTRSTSIVRHVEGLPLS